MRNPLVVVGALLALAGCHCGEKVSGLAPESMVTSPTAKDGDAYLLDLGAWQVGVAATKTIVVENHGTMKGTITGIALRAGSDPAFSLPSPDAPRTLGPAGSTTIDVRFQGAAKGSATGWVDLTTDDPQLPTATVELVAKAQSAAVEVCVQADADGGWTCAAPELGQLGIDFGSMLVGSPPVSRKMRVRNLGDLALTYFGTTLVDPSSPEFTIEPSQDVPLGGVPLAAGGELQFDAVFTPAAPAAVSGTAEVTTSDGAKPVVDVRLTAVAAVTLVCHVTVLPARLDFGNVIAGSSQELSVAVVNTGTQACTLTGLPLTGASAFTLPAPPALPTTLAPGTRVTVPVRYTPTGTAAQTGTLTVQSDDPAAPSIAVPLSGSGVAQPDCTLVATPAALNFGGVAPGDRSLLSIALSATGSQPCTVTGAQLRNHDPAFIPAGAYPILLFPGSIGGLGAGSIGVTYAPTAAGADSDVLLISYSVGFGGPSYTANVPLNGLAGQRRLCLAPSRLHFGAVGVGQGVSLPFTMTACGNAAVNVTAITVEPATGTPFSVTPPALPLALARGSSATQAVTVQPTSTAGARAKVRVTSDDPVYPDQYVVVDVGSALVPADAGEVLYSWTAGAFSSGGAMEGTIYRAYLQGPAARAPFYGTAAGQSCSGCHAVSPDGRFVALVEYNTSPIMRIVDARTGGSVPVPGTANGQFPSWRPDVTSMPPYQFVYNDGNVLKVASLTTGVLREVTGANDQTHVQTQPSWGPNGTIAFVRGTPGDAGTFAIAGPADLMTIPEAGGAATAVPGASGNGGGNYYPEFSPNGRYLAFTFSAAGQTTRAANDSVIRLVQVSSGAILNLPQLNAAGPNSWPTWSKDGMFLSFSSTRSGGAGSADIYFAPVDQNTGADGPAQPVVGVNTPNYDHVARWSFLP